MEQQIFGAVLGATSLLAGYVLHQMSQMRSQELSYLQHMPRFTDLGKLKDHLKNSSNNRADVLVEGVVQQLGSNTLVSEKAGVEGAARLVTTTMYTKVYHESDSQSSNSDSSSKSQGSWREMSNTIENVHISVPFNLADSRGNVIMVQSVHKAGGFRHLLQRVWQEKIGPDSRSLGDFATTVITLKEIPNGSLTREFMLVFGTTIGTYGNAVLQNQSFLNTGDVNFTPVEVSSSIRDLISRNEAIVRVMKFFSMVFLVGGGSILFITIALPLMMRWLGMRDDEDRGSRPAIDNTK